MGHQTLIQNCQVEFRNRCSFKWDSLATTADESIRHCSTCERSVFLCTNDKEAIEHARQGDCIAMPMLDGEGLPVVYLGEPQEPQPDPTAEQRSLEAQYHYERTRMDAIRDTKHAEDNCPVCNFPLPKWRKSCRICETKKLIKMANKLQ